MTSSPVHSGSFEVKLPVDHHCGAEDVSHDHPVRLSVVHGQTVHPQVLRKQGLPLCGDNVLYTKEGRINGWTYSEIKKQTVTLV